MDPHARSLQEALAALGLGPDEAQAVAARFRPQAVPSGTRLAQRGVTPEPGEGQRAWYFIDEGLAAAVLADTRGLEHPLALFGPGTLEGEMSLVAAGSGPPPFDTTALTPLSLRTVDAQTLGELVEGLPPLRAALARLAAWRAARFVEQALVLGHGSPAYRIGHQLAALAEWLPAGFMPVAPPDDEPVDVLVPQSVLARLCRVSRTTLSGVLRALQQAGYVDLVYGGLRVLQVRRWRHYLRLTRALMQVPDRPTVTALIALLDRLHDLPERVTLQPPWSRLPRELTVAPDP